MSALDRADFVRMLNEDIVSQAETMPQDDFEEKKWDRLNELLAVYDKVAHTNLFEANRSYVTGLDPEMQLLLIRHTFDIEKPAVV